MTDEQRYTLEEARRELKRRECEEFGHDWDTVVAGGEPVALVCACGEERKVTRP